MIGNDGAKTTKPILKVGDIASGDYTEIENDGTSQAKGDATCWDDLRGSLIGRRLSSTPGTLDYDWEENSIVMSPNGDISSADDRAVFNYQYPHAAVEDGVMNLHVHWTQPNATVRTFTVQYRIQKNGAEKVTAWTTVNTDSGGVNDAFPYVSGSLNQITRIVDIDMTNAGISATVQFRFTRSDSNAGDIEATFVDAHVELDMLGSRSEFVK